jgi:hypothetical protein
MKRKKLITWLTGLLICLILLVVFLVFLDRPHVYGFTLLQDRPEAYIHSYQDLVWMGVEDKTDRYIQAVSFLSRSFQNGNNFYCGYKNNIRVYDLKYQFLNEIDIHSLGIPEGISIYSPVKKESKSMWWTAGPDLPDEKAFLHPRGIIHVTMLEEAPKAVYYEFGEFATAAVLESGKSFLVFRNKQPFYEIYDTVNKDFKSKITVKDYKLDYIGNVFYDELSKKIIVYGRDFSNKKTIIGYIKDQEFTPIDSTNNTLGGLFADKSLFYCKGNCVYQYDLNNGVYKLVFAPKKGGVYSSYYNTIIYNQENNFLCFTYCYRNLIGKLYMSTIYLNLTTKQYYLEEPTPPL